MRLINDKLTTATDEVLDAMTLEQLLEHVSRASAIAAGDVLHLRCHWSLSMVTCQKPIVSASLTSRDLTPDIHITCSSHSESAFNTPRDGSQPADIRHLSVCCSPAGWGCRCRRIFR